MLHTTTYTLQVPPLTSSSHCVSNKVIVSTELFLRSWPSLVVFTAMKNLMLGPECFMWLVNRGAAGACFTCRRFCRFRATELGIIIQNLFRTVLFEPWSAVWM